MKRLLTEVEKQAFLNFFRKTRGPAGIAFRKKYKICLKSDGNWYTSISEPLNITEV